MIFTLGHLQNKTMAATELKVIYIEFFLSCIKPSLKCRRCPINGCFVLPGTNVVIFLFLPFAGTFPTSHVPGRNRTVEP